MSLECSYYRNDLIVKPEKKIKVDEERVITWREMQEIKLLQFQNKSKES